MFIYLRSFNELEGRWKVKVTAWLRYFPVFAWSKCVKPQENLSYVGWPLGWDLNLRRPEYKEEVPSSQLQCSVRLFLQTQVIYKKDTKDTYYIFSCDLLKYIPYQQIFQTGVANPNKKYFPFCTNLLYKGTFLQKKKKNYKLQF